MAIELNGRQISGLNPILTPGDEGDWDGGVIEACNVLRDGDTYYLYYHGTPRNEEKWPRRAYRLSIIEILHSAGSSFTAFRTQNDIFKSHFYVKEVLDLELG